jgi:hypothetical protein
MRRPKPRPRLWGVVEFAGVVEFMGVVEFIGAVPVSS